MHGPHVNAFCDAERIEHTDCDRSMEEKEEPLVMMPVGQKALCWRRS